MFTFLLTFILIYGGMHGYVFWRVRKAYSLSGFAAIIFLLWMSGMTIAPLLVRGAEHSNFSQLARCIAWPAYIWMGCIFIFASLLCATDTALCTFSYIRSRIYSTPFTFPISSKRLPSVVLCCAALLSGYACIEAQDISTEHVVISTSKLAPETRRVRIVQVSDVHLGLLLDTKILHRIVDKVNAEKPDIFISTGDLVDGKLNQNHALSAGTPLTQLLRSVQAPLGKFAVIGNHEVYSGLTQAIEFTSTAGFTVLRNQSQRLANNITITGIDDKAIYKKNLDDPRIESALVNAISRDSFHLLLKHRPDLLERPDSYFDLQLSGHVHGGQIFPFNYLVRLKHPIPCGITRVHGSSYIHISRGTGTWGPPMRLFARPEITVIDLIAGT